jgi:hypothetical protein
VSRIQQQRPSAISHQKKQKAQSLTIAPSPFQQSIPLNLMADG